MIAYLDDLRDGLYDQMVMMLVANDLKYDQTFRERADSEGFNFEEMLKAAADHIRDSAIEDLW